MIPKKIIFFGLLIVGGVAYFLQGRDISEIQGDPNIGKAHRREKAAKAAEEVRAEKTKRGNKYITGECLTNREDAWEITKILAVGDNVYTIIDCHKYKGCTEQKDLPWHQIEFEYRRGRVVKCPR
jgi:hypothetical protein